MTSTSGNAGALAGQTLGEYRLEALIGAGGMAEVYRGRDTKLGREVAVKVLPPHFATDAGYVARFRDEARRVAAIDHANIVPVYQFGDERGLLYIVMPLLRESLRERMERTGLPAVTDAMRITVQVAAALDAAHGQGIVHRDVKPENVLLNQEGRALLTDFGIAREAAALRDPKVAHTLSASGLPVGTPEYMAPEQLRRDNVDQRADIYALGAVLYEMLTGHAPHEASSVYEVAAMALTAPIAPPSAQNHDVWPQLDVAVMTALARDAGERYPDARSFALALRSALQSRNDPRSPRLTVPAYQPMVQDQDSMVLHIVGGGPLHEDGQARSYHDDAADSTGQELAVSPGYWPVEAELTTTRRPRRRRVGLLVAAALVLVVVAVVSASALYVLSGFAPAGITLLPMGSGATGGQSATATDGATPGATGTTTVGDGTPTADSTVPTAIPTAVPTATATPTPPRLILGASPVYLNTFNVCSKQTIIYYGSIAIANPGEASRPWTAAGIPSGWCWSINLANGWNSVAKSGQPSDPGLGSNAVTLYIGAPTGSAGQNITITITDDLNRPYYFIAAAQH